MIVDCERHDAIVNGLNKYLKINFFNEKIIIFFFFTNKSSLINSFKDTIQQQSTDRFLLVRCFSIQFQV